MPAGGVAAVAAAQMVLRGEDEELPFHVGVTGFETVAGHPGLASFLSRREVPIVRKFR